MDEPVAMTPLSHLAVQATSIVSSSHPLLLIDQGYAGLVRIMSATGQQRVVAEMFDLPVESNLARDGRFGTGLATAPGEWHLALLDKIEITALQASVAERGYISDQRDAYVALHLTGADAANLLAKSCPLDFRAKTFPKGNYRKSLLGSIDLLVIKADNTPSFDLLVPAGYAEAVWARLLNEGEEFALVCSRVESSAGSVNS